MPTLVHFEIPPDDVERSRKFYIHLFEWKESHFRSWGIFLGLQSVYTHLAVDLFTHITSHKMALCIEQNKILMRKYFEQVWNRGDVAFIDENLASGFVSHFYCTWRRSDSILFRTSDLIFKGYDSEGDKVINCILLRTTGSSRYPTKLTASGIVRCT